MQDTYTLLKPWVWNKYLKRKKMLASVNKLFLQEGWVIFKTKRKQGMDFVIYISFSTHNNIHIETTKWCPQTLANTSMFINTIPRIHSIPNLHTNISKKLNRQVKKQKPLPPISCLSFSVLKIIFRCPKK
jgi:hypothetical protein